jgi:hypothetical protein
VGTRASAGKRDCGLASGSGLGDRRWDRSHPRARSATTQPRSDRPLPAVAYARVGMGMPALFGRRVISWEWPGRSRPTPSPGRRSAGTAAVPEGCQNSDSALNLGLNPFTHSRSPRPARRGVALQDSTRPVKTARSCRSLTLFNSCVSIALLPSASARHPEPRKNSRRSSRRIGGSIFRRIAAGACWKR